MERESSDGMANTSIAKKVGMTALLFVAQSSRNLVYIITRRAIRRGTFRSVKQLVDKIDQCVHTYNSKSHPFVWTATADSILQKNRKTL